MENYYLLAVICCFSPFIIGGFWFALHDTEQMKREKTEFNSALALPAIEDFMFQEYSYWGFETSNLFNKLLTKLKEVNVYDPRTRLVDGMDIWFKQVTPQLMHDGKCLGYIEHYGYLEDTFWKNIEKCGLHPEQDKRFQQLLISVNKSSWGFLVNNFDNMLFHFGQHFELLPEIENILRTDARFWRPKDVYDLARKHKKKLT